MGKDNENRPTPEQIDVKVRLPREVFGAWQQLALRHGVSVTEELRKIISRSVFIDQQYDAGNRIILAEKNGDYRTIEWNEGTRPTPNLSSDDRPDGRDLVDFTGE